MIILQITKTAVRFWISDIHRNTKKLHIRRIADHTRAFIKVQDGCNQFCSYCIIPYTRGRVRSRRPEDIEHEVRGIAEAGYKEIVLTGIHLSSYGVDFKDEQKEKSADFNQTSRPDSGH